MVKLMENYSNQNPNRIIWRSRSLWNKGLCHLTRERAKRFCLGVVKMLLVKVELKGCPCVLSLHILPQENSNRVLSKVKTKDSVQSFCFIVLALAVWIPIQVAWPCSWLCYCTRVLLGACVWNLHCHWPPGYYSDMVTMERIFEQPGHAQFRKRQREREWVCSLGLYYLWFLENESSPAGMAQLVGAASGYAWVGVWSLVGAYTKVNKSMSLSLHFSPL